ncbi:hypothetical protein JCM5353_006061 [Sporobolomyces roseus]
MGCVSSTGGSHASLESKSIEEELKRTRKELASTIRTLMLGPGESGKSTVVKQMRLAYSRPYSRGERERFKEIVYGNTLQSMQVTINGFDIVDIPFPEKHKDEATLLLSLAPEDATDIVTGKFKSEIANAIQSLWKEPATKEVVRQSFRFQLNDSAPYFFDELSRLSHPDYLPTDQDILHCRVRTTGISEEAFTVDGVKLLVVDVGGQRSERKKWLHQFETCQLLIFVAAVSEYDQVSFEWFIEL